MLDDYSNKHEQLMALRSQKWHKMELHDDNDDDLDNSFRFTDHELPDGYEEKQKEVLPEQISKAKLSIISLNTRGRSTYSRLKEEQLIE